MVTGDAPATAAIVARRGRSRRSRLSTRTDPRRGGPRGFRRLCRRIPEGKNDLVKAFQKSGHTVGMCGDGANNARALRQAQMGRRWSRDDRARDPDCDVDGYYDARRRHPGQVVGDGQCAAVGRLTIAGVLRNRRLRTLAFVANRRRQSGSCLHQPGAPVPGVGPSQPVAHRVLHSRCVDRLNGGDLRNRHDATAAICDGRNTRSCRDLCIRRGLCQIPRVQSSRDCVTIGESRAST